jgi:uncharacterized protein YdeI (YjbR/CyaY-like superfamily)
MESGKAQSLPRLSFRDQQAWAHWLQINHGTSPGLWIQLAKKGSAGRSLSYAEAVEVALCYGWIDGQSKGNNATSWLQKFTPRRKRSIWSKINRERAERLISEGRMQPAGLAEVGRARQDGRWEAAYDSPRVATVPADFQTALKNRPQASAFFGTLNSQNRFAILFRLQTAKKSGTRARRIEQFIRMLENHEKLYP